MVRTIVALLLVLWGVGLFFEAAGGFVHLLLVVAAGAVIFRLIQGRSALP